MINSLDKGSKTHDPDWINERLRLTVWDMIDVSEYSQKNGTTLYQDRFEELTKLVKNCDCIDDVNVFSGRFRAKIFCQKQGYFQRLMAHL